MLKNKKKITSQFLLIVFSLLVLLSPDEIFARKPPQKQTLRVALFPYIPDSAKDNYKALLKRIETEFEKKNHLIDLQLRPLNANDDFYGTDQLKTWLSSASGDDAYDIVEVDALLLDDLVKNDVISNWKTQLNIKDWHPAGYRASVINNQIYGVPHWLCGHFIISHDQSISEAKSLSDLINLLSKANTNIPNLTADLLGSWNLPSIYLDVWADTYGASNVAKGLNVNLDKEVLNQLKSFSNQCMTEGKNPCLEKTYDDNDEPALQFANKKSDIFFGYSERLSFILSQNNTENVYIASAPIGKGKNPVLFVDTLVKRKDCNAQCEDAATKFALYLNLPTTQEWILMSRDSNKQATPRYLIPATKSAFKQNLVSKDKYYKKIESEIKNGVAYPNTGLPAIRSKMRDAILAELKKP